MPPYPRSPSTVALVDASAARRGGAGVLPGSWLVAMLLASVISLKLLMGAAGLTISPSASGDEPFYICGVAALALRLGLPREGARWCRAIGDAAEYCALFTAIGLIGTVASYPVAALSHGYADAGLERIDRLLGFDWLAWYRTVAAHPVLQVAGGIAYRSIYLTPAILLGHFAWHGRSDEARRFLVTFWVAGILTLTLYAFMPAVGPLAWLWHGPLPYLPASALWQPQMIPELRAHTLHVVDLGRLRGLVSAPSFHTASAVLFVAAAWPIRGLRVPLTVLNVAMLLSTPVEGTHYLADMLAGAAVAAVALVIVRLVVITGRVIVRHRGGNRWGASPLG